MLAEIITIGDEILIGQITDSNSAWIGKELNKIGISVKQISSISDNADHITEALNLAKQRADIILMTGGLGPTKDDITKITLSTYFNMPLKQNAEALANVQNIFAKLNRPMIDANIRQAEIPFGCAVIQNKNGTAPGMWFDVNGKVFVSLPGVPFEMMYLMKDEIIPRLKKRFKLPHIIHKVILTAGQGESFLAQQIADIEDNLPSHVKLAYLPKLGQVRLRLSAKGSDEGSLAKEVNHFASLIIERVRNFFVTDEDIPLELAVLQKMKQAGFTLSAAESCTGGYISHLITQHAGSSAVFKGGAVAYANSLKKNILGVSENTLQTHGAVSEETVKEMALGAIKYFETDYSIAVSGIAGPSGATKEKPVGTVYIAIANKNNKQAKAKCLNFNGKRMQNIERSASLALMLLFNALRQDLK